MARTKEELKALIAKLTYENTSDCLVATILNEMLDGMGGSELIPIDIPTIRDAEDQWVDVTDYFKDKFDRYNPQKFFLRSDLDGSFFYMNGHTGGNSSTLSYGFFDHNNNIGYCVTIQYNNGIYKMYWSDLG